MNYGSILFMMGWTFYQMHTPSSRKPRYDFNKYHTRFPRGFQLWNTFIHLRLCSLPILDKMFFNKTSSSCYKKKKINGRLNSSVLP